MYTFSMKWRINDVPITCYLMTHAYFIFYHSLTNLVLRRLRRSLAASSRFASFSISALTILALAYVTAFMETFTISNFPYYSFENRHFAYTIGSAFYAIYYVVSFPMFLRIDEQLGSSSSSSSRFRCPPPHAARAPSHSGQQMATFPRRHRRARLSHARHHHARRVAAAGDGSPRFAVGCCTLQRRAVAVVSRFFPLVPDIGFIGRVH